MNGFLWKTAAAIHKCFGRHFLEHGSSHVHNQSNIHVSDIIWLYDFKLSPSNMQHIWIMNLGKLIQVMYDQSNIHIRFETWSTRVWSIHHSPKETNIVGHPIHRGNRWGKMVGFVLHVLRFQRDVLQAPGFWVQEDQPWSVGGER